MPSPIMPRIAPQNGAPHTSPRSGCTLVVSIGALYMGLSIALLTILRKVLVLLTTTDLPSADLQSTLVDMVATLFFALAVLVVTFSMANQYPSVQVKPEGLLVRVFLWRFVWLLVYWGEIEEVISAPRKYYQPGRASQRVYIIRANHLSPWLCLVSSMWHCGWRPGILLLPDMERREELLNTIRSHISVLPK